MSRLIAYGSSPIKEDFAFPAQIAQHLGREYVSRVKPLNSNHKLARTVISQTYEPGDLVLIDWATTVRQEFRTEHGWMTVSRETYKPGSGFEEQWYQGPGCWEYTPIYSALKEIVLTQTFLKTQGIDYVFTFDYDDVIHSTLLSEPDEYIGPLKNLIDWSRVVLFEGHGFLYWAKEKQFDIDGGHAEKAAHDCAAEYFIRTFKF